MKFSLKVMIIAAALALTACKPQPKMIPLGGASADDPAVVARVKEGTMLMRGLDGKRLELNETANPFSDAAFAILPGQHELIAMSIQSGHFIPTENMRCYILKANLEAGVLYRLDEDRESFRAILRRNDSGMEVASTSVMEKRESFGTPCGVK